MKLLIGQISGKAKQIKMTKYIQCLYLHGEIDYLVKHNQK